MEEEPLTPDQQIEVVCQLAQEAFNNKTLELESQLADVRLAVGEQDEILAQQGQRREELEKQTHDLRKALQELKSQIDAEEQHIDDLAQQKQKLLEFKATLLRTVNGDEVRSASSEQKTPAWESYLTERKPDSGRESNIFSVMRDLKTELPSDEYLRLAQEVRRMTKGEQSKTETLAKLRVLLRGHEESLSVLQRALEGS